MSIYDTPEFMADALDDLASLYAPKAAPSAPQPGSGWNPNMRIMAAQLRRFAGIGDPAFVGGTGLDLGFLLACNATAPDVFADLVAWRVGGASVADLHARSGEARVAEDQSAARRARRHREYVDGMRTRALSEAM